MKIEVNNLFRKLKYRKQRADQGYSDYDLMDMDVYLTNLIPTMLKDLKKYKSFPSFLEPKDENLSEEESFKIARKKWVDILDKIIFAFEDANDETTTFKNIYEEEYSKKLDEFFEKYGYQGEKLKGNEKKEKEVVAGKKTYVYSAIKPINFEDISKEYKQLQDNYFAEEHKKNEYLKNAKKKAFELLSEYLPYLWW